MAQSRLCKKRRGEVERWIEPASVSWDECCGLCTQRTYNDIIAADLHTPHVYQDSGVLIYIRQMAALPLAADEHAVRRAPRARLCGQLIATIAQDASVVRVKSTATQPSIIGTRHMLPINTPMFCPRDELGLTLISHGAMPGRGSRRQWTDGY